MAGEAYGRSSCAFSGLAAPLCLGTGGMGASTVGSGIVSAGEAALRGGDRDDIVSRGRAVVLALIFDDGAPKQGNRTGGRPDPGRKSRKLSGTTEFVGQAQCVHTESPHSTGTSVQSRRGCCVFVGAAEAHHHDEQASQLRGMGAVKVD